MSKAEEKAMKKRKNVNKARIAALILAAAALACVFASCGQKPLSGSVTVKQWLDAKGEGEDLTLSVKVLEIVNPVLAIVGDDTGSVHLYGILIDGEFKSFDESGLSLGDEIVLSGGSYNEFEGVPELKEADLVKKK